MTEELRAKMEELRAIAPRLNKTSDSASTLIRTVETFLDDLGIGVSGTSRCFDQELAQGWEDDVTRTMFSYLAYGRVRGDFRIHVLRQTTHEEMNTFGFMGDVVDAEEEVHWSSLSREDKLKSFAQLPSLLDSILSNAKSQVEEADKAAATVGEMLSTLGVAIANPDDEGAQPPLKKRRGSK
jgi:hypothetical protein